MCVGKCVYYSYHIYTRYLTSTELKHHSQRHSTSSSAAGPLPLTFSLHNEDLNYHWNYHDTLVLPTGSGNSAHPYIITNNTKGGVSVTLTVTDLIPLTAVEVQVMVYNVYGSGASSISNTVVMGYTAPVCGINHPIGSGSGSCKPPGIHYGIDYTHAVLSRGAANINSIKPLPVSTLYMIYILYIYIYNIYIYV